jgi:hypothetical protein
MNGFKLKAYTNLFKKGKNLDVDKISKKEKKEINREEMYKHIYFKTKPTTKNKMNEKDTHPWAIYD